MQMKDKLPAINSLLQNPPAEIGFSAKEIEEIVRGENLRDHMATINRGFYLDNFLTALGWCLHLGRILTYAPPETDLVNVNPAVAEDAEWTVKEKLDEVMQLYLIAYESRLVLEGAGPDPTGLELVKRYWELREYVLKLIRRDYPEVDLGQTLRAA